MGIIDEAFALARRGAKIRCSRTARWSFKDEMNPDGKGGYRLKEYDYFIRDNQRSKYVDNYGNWSNL